MSTIVKSTYAQRLRKAHAAISLAQYHVLAITELAELILSYLPVADILHAQRWSKWHRELIKTSLLLQRRLFFQPDSVPNPWPPRSASLNTPPPSHPWRINELIYSKFPWLFLTNSDPSSWRPPRSLTAKWGPPHSRTHLAFSRPEASWRRMLPVQPGLLVLEIYEVLHRHFRHDLRRQLYIPSRALLWTAAGLARGRSMHVPPTRITGDISTGMLFDLLSSWLSPTRVFSIQWHMTSLPPPLPAVQIGQFSPQAWRDDPLNEAGRFDVAPYDEDVPLPYATVSLRRVEEVRARAYDEREAELFLADIVPAKHVIVEGTAAYEMWYSDVNEA